MLTVFIAIDQYAHVHALPKHLKSFYFLRIRQLTIELKTLAETELKTEQLTSLHIACKYTSVCAGWSSALTQHPGKCRRTATETLTP
jgi:hypothetical protein